MKENRGAGCKIAALSNLSIGHWRQRRMNNSWNKDLKTNWRRTWIFKRVESYFLLAQDYSTYISGEDCIACSKIHIYTKCIEGKMCTVGSFGDPREFSHHRKAVLSNLTEAVFILQPLLLKAMWFSILKPNTFYQFLSAFINTDINKRRTQNTVWGEYPIFEECEHQ